MLISSVPSRDDIKIIWRIITNQLANQMLPGSDPPKSYQVSMMSDTFDNTCCGCLADNYSH